ncbi:hypothetical protein FRB94_004423 [Tulasnella sp. JGI-2019a]|nr:hypothetical protein FRB94_004423 [Tulasnella sp. JGI-2019a]
MPYATPVSGPLAVHHPFFVSHPIHDLPHKTPASSSTYDYQSNTFATPLNGVPRSRSASGKIRLLVPEPSSSSPSPSAILSNPSDSKRGRVGGGGTTTRFTLTLPSSNSSNSGSDNEEPITLQATPEETVSAGAPCSKPPATPSPGLTYEMGTLGRKRGEEVIRNASTTTETVVSPSSTPSTILFPSPNGLVPSPSIVAPPAAKRFHQAIMAGQGGVLRLNMDAIKHSRGASQSGMTSPPTASLSTKYNTIGPSTFIRKKSGELVKPALRSSSRPPSRAGSAIGFDDAEGDENGDENDENLMPTTANSLMYRRNSAPTTPTPKAVHFDSQLEHVKLFLAEQKPAAVSRSGSPNAYASTTEDEGYPWQGPNKHSPAGKPEEMVLTAKIVDGACVNDTGKIAGAMERDRGVNVRLETLVATAAAEGGSGGDAAASGARNLKGTIIVRNLAFDKRVTARFTMDWWQTTSEVAARYVHPSTATLPPHASSIPSLSGPLPDPTRFGCDRFEFCIKLGDVMSKIEEKTLMLCLRFGVNDGGEWWDNNEGRNYRIGFEKKIVAQPRPTAPVVVVAAPQPIRATMGGAQFMQRAETVPASTSSTAAASRSLSPPKRQQRDRDVSPAGPRDQAGGGAPTAAAWSPRKDQMLELRRELERAVNERLAEDDDDDDGVVLRTKRRAPVFRKGITIPTSNTSSPSLSPVVAASPSSTNPPPPPQLSNQLSNRYDFNASLRAAGSWKPPALPSNHDGALMFPSQRKASMAVITQLQPQVPFPSASPISPERTTVGIEKPLGSPRDAPDAGEQLVQPQPQLRKSGKRHHRSYFDGWVETVRKSTSADVNERPDLAAASRGSAGPEDEDDEATEKEQETNAGASSTSTVVLTSTSNGTVPPYHPTLTPRYNSFPPVRPSVSSSMSAQLLSVAPHHQQHGSPSGPSDLSDLLSPLMGGSMASTPSATSASSPSPSSLSPSSPPHSLPVSPSPDLNVGALLGLEGPDGSVPRRMGLDDQGYNVFLNRFCFYTGDSNASDPAIAPASEASALFGGGIMNPRRTHSESEVDNYFAMHNGRDANNNNFGFGFGFPVIGGADSWGGMTSGHATPTGRSPRKGGDKDVVTPRPGTPLGAMDLETSSLTAAVATMGWTAT